MSRCAPRRLWDRGFFGTASFLAEPVFAGALSIAPATARYICT